MATLNHNISTRLIALLFIVIIQSGCSKLNDDEHKMELRKSQFKQFQKPIKNAKRLIIEHQWQELADEDWKKNEIDLREGDEGVMVIHIRRPFIHFEIRTSGLDANQAYVYIPSGKSIQDYKAQAEFANRRLIESIRVDDEWYWILYD